MFATFAASGYNPFAKKKTFFFSERTTEVHTTTLGSTSGGSAFSKLWTFPYFLGGAQELGATQMVTQSVIASQKNPPLRPTN